MFFLDWKLHAKLLLFIGIPLIFCLGFIGIIHNAHRSAEAESARLEHSRNVISTAVDLNLLTARAVQQLLFFSQTHDDRLQSAFDQTVHRLPEQVTNMRSLLGRDTEAHALLDEVDRCEDEATALLLQVKQAIAQDASTSSMPDLTRVIACIADLNNAINKVIALEKSHEQKSSSSDAEVMGRHLVETTLFGGVLSVIVLAGVLLFLVNKSVTSRMAVLMSNIRAIGEAKVLPAPLAGRDEIAELDAVLHQMNEKLKEMEQLKRDFTSMITHDLRSPLASIQLSLQMALSGRWGELEPSLTKSLTVAERSSNRLLALINELLEVDKMEAGKLELDPDFVPLAYVFETSAGAVKSLAVDKNVTVDVPDTSLTVYADGDRLVQVFVNLLSNAIKFSPNHATVKVQVQEMEDRLEIRVIDEGSGIPEKYKDSLFEKFKQVSTKDGGKKGGTGLGLVISKLIIEAHGGTIGFTSQEGKGTTFLVTIPKHS